MVNFKIFKSIKSSEWLCIFFFTFSLIKIITNSNPLDWQSIKWSEFPRIDLLAIFLSVWFFKNTKAKVKLRYLGLFALICGLYVFPDKYQSFFIAAWYLCCSLIFFLNDIKWFKQSLSTLREILPFFIMLYCYPFIPLLYHSNKDAINFDLDPLLLKFDLFLFHGINPHLFIENLFHPFFIEVLAAAYTFYSFLIAASIAFVYVLKKKEYCEELIFMLVMCMTIGYISYLYIPAIGPLYTIKFIKPLDLVYMKNLKTTLMDNTRIARDCFPSLHTAITIILCYQINKHANQFAKWILLPFAMLIPLACVVLRYHYVVDVIAGAFLALLIISTVTWLSSNSIK